jgi:PAS domain S-box-containing protein
MAVSQARKPSREEFLAAIVGASNDAITAVDVAGTVLSWNGGAERLYGYTAEEMMGQNIAVLLPAESRGDLHALLDRMRRGESLMQLEGVRLTKDGRRIHVAATVSPIVDTSGRILGASSIARDIGERVRAEAALRESHYLLEEAQAVAHIGSWGSGVNMDDRLSWSKECYRIFGLPEGSDVRVQTFFDRVHPDDRSRIERARDDAIERDSPYAIEHRIVRPDGTVRWLYQRAIAVRGTRGEALRLIGVVQDVTERREGEERLRRTEEQLMQARKMEAIGRLAAGVAHDFNNLLSVIMSYASVLHERLQFEEPFRIDVEEILRAAGRAEELTRQLLAFGRQQMLQPRDIDLPRLLSGMDRMLRRVVGDAVALSLPAEGSAGAVYADPGQVERVILNLVVNARDAMPGGGHIEVETSEVEVHETDGTAHPAIKPGRYVVVTVRDDGQGMDAATLERIFEPFFTTKERGKGTGLGLATVFGIVKQSGGHVQASSEPGKGSRFDVYFPRAAEPSVASPPSPIPTGQAPDRVREAFVRADLAAPDSR